MIKRLARLLTIDPFYGFACEWKWFRKAIGGRWVLMKVDYPINREHWFEWVGPGRPFFLCRGDPLAIEDYRDKENDTVKR